jgi:sugar phosphate isomerase/epimerase
MGSRLGRRRFLRNSGLLAGVLAAGTPRPAPAQAKGFKISLAEWSLHKAVQSRLMTNLDFPRIAREQFGIEGLEFVNGLWEAPTESYVARLKRNISETGTQAVLIMCDGEGQMGHTDKAARMKAVGNHYKWVEIAAELGCHAIRTNMRTDDKQVDSAATANQAPAAAVEEFVKRCTETFRALGEYSRPRNINVTIENHGGLSSDPDVVVRVMKAVSLPNVGTLPDFGNFPDEIDKYEAVTKMMAFAKAVSMKCYDFGPDGNETMIDMARMMKVVTDAGYHSWVGIEYEGRRLTEFEGIQAAKRLLDRLM